MCNDKSYEYPDKTIRLRSIISNIFNNQLYVDFIHYQNEEMSADIGSAETKTGSDMSIELEAAATGVGGLNIENHGNLPSDEGDAADFLLSNSKYHDCFLTVGNPECDKVERIGVTSVDLIAHSPVFREMLENYKQADLPHAKINITDVSPASFKLMLRYVYGGKLPKMTAIETAGLALCADKYKIPRLTQKSLKRLVPSGAEDVFPPLICVTYASFPALEDQVTKIIQQETDMVVENADFLKLDENCVLFMLKQDTLNIDEVELWEHVVRWAEHQVEINPTRTVRDCLAKILGHVRFLTFTIEEVLEHVLPKEILTPEEYVDLSLALTKKRTLKSPLLCKIQEKRNLNEEDDKAFLVISLSPYQTLSPSPCQTLSPSPCQTLSPSLSLSLLFDPE